MGEVAEERLSDNVKVVELLVLEDWEDSFFFNLTMNTFTVLLLKLSLAN